MEEQKCENISEFRLSLDILKNNTAFWIQFCVFCALVHFVRIGVFSFIVEISPVSVAWIFQIQ